ncbi:putative bifunctional diguanylate cyclase/phosphodiesterase [Jiella mangrovi]|uniref:EAL domain-containing protein n=1 Tax=Jiella mangrovi TaxID=2821407 RepID=A0ABS4BD63_9HYPH|nr:EAL domain-containing protein [Jiella mangrovi]MBP0614685.1 EAL domain-containing protein [Jiella mangrovi]
MTALAAVMCAIGSAITVRLWTRTLQATGRMRIDWAFLTSVTAGAAIWATHFIAMLGYDPPAAATFDPQLTIISILIAILGTGIGFYLSAMRRKGMAWLLGGSTIGLSIAAMHYVGMFAYRVDGIVTWNDGYIALSLAGSIGLSLVATKFVLASLDEGRDRRATRLLSIGFLIAAIVTLHFTGMTAFHVSPIAGFSAGADSEAFGAMALAIATAALIIVFTGLSSHLIDNDTRAAQQRELEHIANHDELTGLWNRRRFSAGLAEAFETREAGIDPLFLVMIDLDRFKSVNDTLGHGFGDRVLEMVANRLRKIVGRERRIARIGGDEFAILVTDATEEDVADLCRCLVEVMSRAVVVDGHVIEMGTSIGAAQAFRDGASRDELVQNADIALYAAKAEGRCCFRFYVSEMSQNVQLRRTLETDLRRALGRGELAVQYQPQVDAKTGAYTGAEALLRWYHPEKGLIPPTDFIPLAEEIGLINAIGTWVLRQACLEATNWPRHMGVAVNLSPVQIMDRRLLRSIKTILSETGLDPKRLELEITETALLGNDEQALATLSAISDFGVAIALDDFGTGYSSLSYLHRFPIDRIKIDRSFLQSIPEDSDSATIVQAITRLGANLGMKVTAEGIETEVQQRFASNAGCDTLQGYFFSRPVTSAQLMSVLETTLRAGAA